MQSAIAEEVLSDNTQKDSEVTGGEGISTSAMLNLLLDLLGNQLENGGKDALLRIDGPIAEIAFLEKAAAYIGLTRSALETALRRGEMPGHKKRKNPEDESSGGRWVFNVKLWNELADELPELEPPEWHHWKDYWTYDRGSRKFQKARKEDCLKVEGRRVYKPRKSKMEQANGN
ncbi:TPA: transcriptional regulator [Salmonella enterica subsp. enterica serovar Poona]|nr:transcriptional regulator [Salmonella enterica subsp. diarizonae]EGB0326184.1 transcriptional regulator [Salmonella enterica]EKB5040423.1 transcriptional regulator [Salmonella enterica]EME1064888.1 transcriptional regulator [Salmonella enterica]HEC9416278.1 transcriptional regulator [Salmonella enterica subsp. enterica serovar Poona]